MDFKRLLTGALISLFSFGTYAEAEWKMVDAANGFVISIDTNSISNVSEHPYQTNKKVWTRSLVYNDLVQDGLAVGDYLMILYWVNCNNKTLGLKSASTYNKLKNGTWNNNSQSNSYVSMEDIIPGSVGEGIVNGVCS